MLQPQPPAKEVSRFLPAIDSQLIGKAALANELGWSRPKLDRRLESDPHFPVVYRGGKGNGRGWQFDLDAVQNYLAGNPESAETPDAIRESSSTKPISNGKKDSSGDPDVTQIDERPRTSEHQGEATARSRRDTAQAQILEDKIRKDRAQLVEVEDLRNTLSTVLLHLGKRLDTLPDSIVARCNLAPAHAISIRELVNNIRTSMVKELQQLMPPNAGQSD
jgi:phage terminase Nu1 subunit (DNA packaging protein)